MVGEPDPKPPDYSSFMESTDEYQFVEHLLPHHYQHPKVLKA